MVLSSGSLQRVAQEEYFASRDHPQFRAFAEMQLRAIYVTVFTRLTGSVRPERTNIRFLNLSII